MCWGRGVLGWLLMVDGSEGVLGRLLRERLDGWIDLVWRVDGCWGNHHFVDFYNKHTGGSWFISPYSVLIFQEVVSWRSNEISCYIIL